MDIDINIIIDNIDIIIDDDNNDNNNNSNEIAPITNIIIKVKGSNLPPRIKIYIEKKFRPNIYIGIYYE